MPSRGPMVLTRNGLLKSVSLMVCLHGCNLQLAVAAPDYGGRQNPPTVMAEPASKRAHQAFCGQHPTSYCNWEGSTPRIASVLTPFNDENMRLAAQIGITGQLQSFSILLCTIVQWLP